MAVIFASKISEMHTKFFNIIPSEGGKVAILLYGDVGDGQKVDSGRVVAELLALETQYDKIDVRINSCGGDVFSGMAIYTALRNSKADITIYIDGVAASIAGIIALCGKPLYMSPYAKLMLHSVSGGAWGNASGLREMAAQMEALQNDLAAMIAGRCGMTKEDVLTTYFDEKDHWISAKEALTLKLIDGIYEMAEEPVPTQSPEELYTYFNNRLHKQPLNINNEMGLLDSIKKVPSFANMASEDDVLAHIRELENKATKVESLEKTVNSYKEKLQSLEDKEVAAFIDKAIAEKRITDAQKESFTALMKSDRENTEKLINSMKPQPERRITNVYNDNGGASPASLASKTWDELDKAGQLANLRNADFNTFKAKYKERFGEDYKE